MAVNSNHLALDAIVNRRERKKNYTPKNRSKNLGFCNSDIITLISKICMRHWTYLRMTRVKMHFLRVAAKKVPPLVVRPLSVGGGGFSGWATGGGTCFAASLRVFGWN